MSKLVSRWMELHYPVFCWEISGEELIENGVMRKELGGTELFLAFERLSDKSVPREVSGSLEVLAKNGSHGHRPVYLMGRQIDDAKVWTTALFIEFK